MRRVVGLLVGLTLLASPVSASVRWFQPIMNLPKSTLPMWRCIMWHESRSTFAHPNLRDNNPYGSSGIFQITPILWNAWAQKVGVRVPVWRATPYQQALVAVEVWRVDGFSPWTRYDGC